MSSFIVEYFAIDFERARRIRSMDKPWQLRTRISKKSGSTVWPKEVNRRFNSFRISTSVGNLNSTKVIKS